VRQGCCRPLEEIQRLGLQKLQAVGRREGWRLTDIPPKEGDL